MKESAVMLFKNDHYVGKAADLKEHPVKSIRHIDCGLLVITSIGGYISIFHHPASDTEGKAAEEAFSQMSGDIKPTRYSTVSYLMSVRGLV